MTLKREDIIRMAQEAWKDAGEGWVTESWFFDRACALERFAALVAEAAYKRGYDEGGKDFEAIVLPTAVAAERKVLEERLKEARDTREFIGGVSLDDFDRRVNFTVASEIGKLLEAIRARVQ